MRLLRTSLDERRSGFTIATGHRPRMRFNRRVQIIGHDSAIALLHD
jgi:hypothetical protein